MKRKDEPCRRGGTRDGSGNCSVLGDDDLPVQCVGPWVQTKHDYLRRYIEATHRVRDKFLTKRQGGPTPGGAAFVDLFAGPGRAHIRDTGEEIDGSPLIALRQSDAPFSRVISCDLAPENIAALESRTRAFGSRAVVVAGDCNEQIQAIVQMVPKRGLNVAMVDPYGLQTLKFETLAALGRIERMDLLIHFPTGTIKRNLRSQAKNLDAFLGTDRWRKLVRGPSDVAKLIDVLREQLASFGYRQEHIHSLDMAESIRAPGIKNQGGTLMYHLVFASKGDLGNKIWQSIAKRSGPQMNLPIG